MGSRACVATHCVKTVKYTIVFGFDPVLDWIVKPEEANLTSLPLEAVQRVFRSAESLLSKENAIVQAPGSNKMAFLVESKTSKRPHYVFAEKTGRVTCENCPGWASANLCKHAAAVGEKTQQLSKYIE